MTLSTKWKRTFSLITLFVAPSPLVAQDVRIGVLGLFHPREFVVSAVPGSGCVVRTGKKNLFWREARASARSVCVSWEGQSQLKLPMVRLALEQ